MLDEKKSPLPSLFERLCFCKSEPHERIPSSLLEVPELRGLGGLLLQDGGQNLCWLSYGSLFTLKFSTFDKAALTLRTQVIGGSAPGGTGTWAEHLNPCFSDNCEPCFINCLRLASLSYDINFSEDMRSAQINIKMNPCVCVPCLPSWCTLPLWLAKFTMAQAPGTEGGVRWQRESTICCCVSGPCCAYDIVQVLSPEAEAGPYHERLEQVAPKQLFVSR